MRGIFSGKLIKNQEPSNREVQYGPLIIPKLVDPLEDILNRTIGEIPYEANGVVEWRPENIQFLGS
jgi:hypothetical protein